MTNFLKIVLIVFLGGTVSPYFSPHGFPLVWAGIGTAVYFFVYAPWRKRKQAQERVVKDNKLLCSCCGVLTSNMQAKYCINCGQAFAGEIFSRFRRIDVIVMAIGCFFLGMLMSISSSTSVPAAPVGQKLSPEEEHAIAEVSSSAQKNIELSPQNEMKVPALFFVIGQPTNFDKLQVTVDAVELFDAGSALFANNPTPGCLYIGVTITAKNISTMPVGPFSQASLKLIDCNGVEYSQDISRSGEYSSLTGKSNDNTKILSNLNPGVSMVDHGAWEVSKDLFMKSGWKLLVKENNVERTLDIDYIKNQPIRRKE